MSSLRGSILVSALFHGFLLVLLLFSSGTGGTRAVYRPEYRVRLVRPEEVPSLRKVVAKKKVKPTRPPPGPSARPKADKVVLPKKEKKPERKKKEALPSPQAKKRVAKKPARQVAEKKPTPSPEQVLEEALRRIRKKAASRPGTGSETPPEVVSGWKEKQREIEYKAYYDAVERAVRENWIPPQDMDFQGEPEMTVVSITLLPDGRVLKSSIEESSGDPLFDQSVMRAILKSTPFPPPPIGLNQQTFELGLRFHSRPGAP